MDPSRGLQFVTFVLGVPKKVTISALRARFLAKNGVYNSVDINFGH